MIYRRNFRQSLLNLGMAVAVIVPFILLIRTFFVYRLFTEGKNMDVLSLLTHPFALSTFGPFACIFPMLPYSFSYLDEKNSGYIKYIILRCSKRKYIFNKLFFTGLSGGVSMFLTFLVIFIIADVCAQDVSQAFYPYMYEGKIWEPYVMAWGGRLVLLMRLVLVFLFGVLWALVGLLVSTVIPNKYVSFILPFAMYQLGWMFLPGVINPHILLRADFDVRQGVTMSTPYLVQGAFIILVGILTVLMLKKRIGEG